MSLPLTLEGFLTKHKSDVSLTHTKIGNTALGIYGGAYHIPNSDKARFYELYEKEVINEGKDSYLTEVQLPEKGPILVDIDERYDTIINKRQHSTEHIIDLISLYIDKIISLVTLTDSDNVSFSAPNSLHPTNNPTHSSTRNDTRTTIDPIWSQSAYIPNATES